MNFPPFTFCWIVFFAFNISFCKAQRNAKIQDKQEACLNSIFLAQNTAGQAGFSGVFVLQASCSGSSNYSPSCTEYYAPSSKEILCPLGYTKSNSKCSVQNLVGICRYRPAEALDEVRTAVFVKPKDNYEAARLFCDTISDEKIFTETYFSPTERTTSLNTILTNGFLCFEKASKN